VGVLTNAGMSRDRDDYIGGIVTNIPAGLGVDYRRGVRRRPKPRFVEGPLGFHRGVKKGSSGAGIDVYDKVRFGILNQNRFGGSDSTHRLTLIPDG